jgi:hypothetical protein
LLLALTISAGIITFAIIISYNDGSKIHFLPITKWNVLLIVGFSFAGTIAFIDYQFISSHTIDNIISYVFIVIMISICIPLVLIKFDKTDKK